MSATHTAEGLTGHVCNCIGCCPKCGQCRTTSWHSRTCRQIEQLNRMRHEVIVTAQTQPPDPTRNRVEASGVNGLGAVGGQQQDTSGR